VLNKLVLPAVLLTIFCGSAGTAENDETLFLFPKRTFPGGVILVRFPLKAEETGPAYQLTINGKVTSWELCPNTKKRALCAFVGVELDNAPEAMKAEVRKNAEPTLLAASGTIPVGTRAYSKHQLKVSPAHGNPSPEDLKRVEDERHAMQAIYDSSAQSPLWEKPFKLPGKWGTTSPFGSQRVFNGKIASTHYGVDLRGNEATWVLSANAGKVVFADILFNSGRFVAVDHGGKIFTTYSHMSAFAVKKGESVTQGQHVGKIGRTGRVTGPHLHWAVRIDGLYVDPLEFIKVAAAVWK
jgi:murein DD-endopeptidase MepM/ murein hydrolase activator NlpD